MSNGQNDQHVLDPDHELDHGPGELDHGTGGVSEPTTAADAVTPATDPLPEVASQVDGEKERESDESLVWLGLPLRAPKPDVYLQSHIDIRLTPRQKKAVRWLYEGLHATHATLASGKHVDTVSEAVKFLLDAIADEIADEE